MMKVVLMLIFLIPIAVAESWWLMVIGLMIEFVMCFLTFHFFDYLSFISYGFGMDLISGWLILLTLWVSFLMVMASVYVKLGLDFLMEFMLLVLVLCLFLVMCFVSSNMFLFYFFFESSIIPTLFLVFGWGYQVERLMAGLYFLFYTLFASLPMLVALFWIMNYNFTLFISIIDVDFGICLYLSMFMAFFVKMPMVFFHYWLPSAHVEAPVSGSMILAGVLLKLGGYGMYRVMSFAWHSTLLYNDYFIIISMVGMVFVGILCLFQVDMSAMVAYSSVSHMALVICGILALNIYGLTGSFIMMIGHGLCSSALFCLVNMSYERTFTRSLYVNKGLITIVPSISMFWFMFCANNMACPNSLNLFGEFMLINSLVSWSLVSLLFLGVSSFLSCCINIYLYSITQHGNFSVSNSFSTVSVREYLLLLMHWIPLNLLFLGLDTFCGF
uniref:NADH-ubiquinone oxidoreductase chain 4 n=1 Tax=Arbanatus sp. TaxID=2931282 RepID=A0A8T9ZY74_9HEMI|nr:NADH dehydrogenase subunit 4 [Arbanatus sp.]